MRPAADQARRRRRPARRRTRQRPAAGSAPATHRAPASPVRSPGNRAGGVPRSGRNRAGRAAWHAAAPLWVPLRRRYRRPSPLVFRPSRPSHVLSLTDRSVNGTLRRPLTQGATDDCPHTRCTVLGQDGLLPDPTHQPRRAFHAHGRHTCDRGWNPATVRPTPSGAATVLGRVALTDRRP